VANNEQLYRFREYQPIIKGYLPKLLYCIGVETVFEEESFQFTRKKIANFELSKINCIYLVLRISQETPLAREFSSLGHLQELLCREQSTVSRWVISALWDVAERILLTVCIQTVKFRSLQ